TASRSTPAISSSTVLPAAPPRGVRRSKRTAGRSARAGALRSMQESRAVLSFNHMISTKLCVPFCRLPQNLVHCFTLRQLVDQLVEIADFSPRRFFAVFYSDTANQTLDQSA